MRWRPEVSAFASSASALAGAAPRRRMAIFLGLFIVPGVAQSILLTVVPLEALRLLGTARAVTLLSTLLPALLPSSDASVFPCGGASDPAAPVPHQPSVRHWRSSVPLCWPAGLRRRLPVASRSAALRLRASRSPATFICSTTSRVTRSGASNRPAFSPVPGRGHSARGSGFIFVSSASRLRHRLPSRPSPRW